MGYAFCKITTPRKKPVLKKVTGIGGVFFKSRNPEKLREWYAHNLGMSMDKYGTSFEWRQAADSNKKGFTQWSLFTSRTSYFEPSTKEFMINYRVENIEALVTQLKKDSVIFTDTIQSMEYGKFVHIMDIESNKIELWEPIDEVYNKSVIGRTK